MINMMIVIFLLSSFLFLCLFFLSWMMMRMWLARLSLIWEENKEGMAAPSKGVFINTLVGGGGWANQGPGGDQHFLRLRKGGIKEK